MRTNRITSGTLGMLVYPDEYVFAFNPNYLEFTLYQSNGKDLATSNNAFTIAVSSGDTSYSIVANICKGKGRVYISRLFQLLFADDVLETRSIDASVKILLGSTTWTSFSCTVLWSALQIGEQFGRYGIYVHNQYRNGVDHVRDVVWFPHFPFKVSMFRAAKDEGLTVDVDSKRTQTNQSLTGTGIFEVVPADHVDPTAVQYFAKLSIGLNYGQSFATFTKMFDYTFTGAPNNLREIVRLRVDNSTAGYYIRWIDQFGFLQYYLFVKGTRTSKNKISSNEIDYEQKYNGMYFGNITRVQQVTNTDTVKCSAVNLPERVLAYVETIVKSAYVDLYLGKDKNGDEIWLPINVVSGSYKVEADKILQDYEISFTLPDTVTQSL